MTEEKAGDEEGTKNEGDEGGEEEEEEEDSDEDDNVQIVINQDKIEEAKTKIGIKPSARQLPSEKKGRFNVEDFDKVGTIDGTPAQEVDLESLEEKPWKKPGADITDYFNYGFTEDTWAAYCARQKRVRIHESGAGLPNNAGSNLPGATSTYATKTHNGGAIPTLGQGSKRHGDDHRGISNQSSSSGIAVLTADKREYSKKIFDNIDFSVPPPGMNVPPPSLPPNFSAPPPGDDFESHDDNYGDYYGGYEPTQDSQWVAPPSSYQGGGHPNSDAPPGDSAYDDKRDPWQRNGRRSSRDSPSRDRKRRRSRSRSRDRRDYRDYRDRRDRDRDRDRDRERRDREKRRNRSRSRSPRGSRSPSSSSRHKKSKRDKREKSEKSDREIKTEVKEEPEEYNE